MKSFAILFFAFTSSFSAFAISNVGNGGGESEMAMLKMFEAMPAWLKACDQNSNLCFQNAAEGRHVIAAVQTVLKNRPQLKLNFLKKGSSSCAAKEINFVSDSLYINQGTPKDQPKELNELTAILINGLVGCDNSNLTIEATQLKVLPFAKKGMGSKIAVIESLQTDLVVSLTSNQNLHQELTAQMDCSNYHVTSSRNDQLQVRCETNHENFIVFVDVVDDQVKLIAKYNSGDDL